MELKIEKRVSGKKSENGRIRREGKIPAILYVRGKEGIPVTVNGTEFHSHLRKIPEGCLATQVFDVKLEGRAFKAILKDISYERITYAVEHLDLMEVTNNDRVNVYVPVVLKGAERCIGVTQGGQIKKVKRSLKLTVKLDEMPEVFALDVSQLPLGGSIRVKDMPRTSSMRVGLDEEQILVTVSK